MACETSAPSAGAAFFFKQGNDFRLRSDRLLDGILHEEYPVTMIGRMPVSNARFISWECSSVSGTVQDDQEMADSAAYVGPKGGKY